MSKSKFVAPKLAKIKRGAHVFHFPKLIKSIGLGKFFILFFICYLPKAPGLRFFFYFFSVATSPRPQDLEIFFTSCTRTYNFFFSGYLPMASGLGIYYLFIYFCYLPMVPGLKKFFYTMPHFLIFEKWNTCAPLFILASLGATNFDFDTFKGRQLWFRQI